MEKELPPPESLASVNIKPDYPPSEVYSSEPPPAYQRPKSASVQVAKIIAVTVVLVSLVLGGCILASAYITANASCRHLEQELQLLTESMDRYQPLQPEALVQEEPQQKQSVEPLEAQETKAAAKELQETAAPEVQTPDSSTSEDSSSESSSSEDSDSDEEERLPVQIKLPLQIDFDDLAGAMMEKNQRSKMNCVVEKKRAEEVIDHQAKTVSLPFGVNLTTDPRYERVSGERIAIFCESGNVQRQEPQDQEETIMIQPVMIPLPPPQFHTHMAMMAQPQMQQHQPQQQQQQNHIHPMEQMRPPMPNPLIQIQAQSIGQGAFPPNPILQHIAQQIIAQRIQQEQERSQEEVQTNELRQDSEERPQQMHERIPIPEEILTQINRLPNRDVVIAVQQQAPEEVQEEVRVVQQPRESAQGMNGRQSYARGLPIPVPVMQQEQEPSASDMQRVHVLHPRSIRSVEDLIPAQKRVKRCNCDCAC